MMVRSPIEDGEIADDIENVSVDDEPNVSQDNYDQVNMDVETEESECGSVNGTNQAKKKLIEADEADALRELLLLQVNRKKMMTCTPFRNENNVDNKKRTMETTSNSTTPKVQQQSPAVQLNLLEEAMSEINIIKSRSNDYMEKFQTLQRTLEKTRKKYDDMLKRKNRLLDSLQECDENIGRYQANISDIVDDIYKLFQGCTNSHVDGLCNVERKCQAMINEEEKRDCSYSSFDNFSVGETVRPSTATADLSVDKGPSTKLNSRNKVQNSIAKHSKRLLKNNSPMMTSIIKSGKKKLSTQRKNQLLQKKLREMGVEIFEDADPHSSTIQRGDSDGFGEDDCRGTNLLNINNDSEAKENLNDNNVFSDMFTAKTDSGGNNCGVQNELTALMAPLAELDVVDKEEEILRRIVSRHQMKHQSSFNDMSDRNGNVHLSVKRAKIAENEQRSTASTAEPSTMHDQNAGFSPLPNDANARYSILQEKASSSFSREGTEADLSSIPTSSSNNNAAVERERRRADKVISSKRAEAELDNLASFLQLYRLNENFPFHLIRHPAVSNRIHPYVPLCPFQLHGRCADERCPWQHDYDYQLTDAEIVCEFLRFYPQLCPENMAPKTYAQKLLENYAVEHVVRFLVTKVPESERFECIYQTMASSKEFRKRATMSDCADETIAYDSILPLYRNHIYCEWKPSGI